MPRATGRTRAEKQIKPREQLHTVNSAASYLLVHPATIRLWCDQGLLPYFRINARGDRRISQSALDKRLKKGLPKKIPATATAVVVANEVKSC
jgi:excisionase family DNA binding protein